MRLGNHRGFTLVASSTAYGYIQTPKISISATGGEINFTGTASHADSTNTFNIDSVGSIN